MPDTAFSSRPMHRTHSLKKRRIRTPGGRTVTHLKYKKHSKHECGICHSELHGKPRGKPVEIRKLNRNKRTVDRPFGGNLCSACSRNILSLRARLKFGELEMKDVPISVRRHM